MLYFYPFQSTTLPNLIKIHFVHITVSLCVFNFKHNGYLTAVLGYVSVSLLLLTLFSMCCQYSDLAEDERASVFEKFRQVGTRWNQVNHAGAGNEDEAGKDDRSHMIIVTDACLPLLASGETPMNAHLLINYDLPAKKVFYILLSVVQFYNDSLCIHMFAKVPSYYIVAFSNLIFPVSSYHYSLSLWCHLAKCPVAC